jgi:site-specific recombinase XerD
MLERYFVRPQTVDHIRALWLGPAIEQYVAWLTERRIASRHVLRCVATLEHFNTFVQGRGVQAWPESITQYVYHLRLFEAYLQRAGVRALADLSPALLTAFLTEPGLRGTRLGPDSMQGRGGTLRVFLRYLHRQQLMATDLSRAVPRRRGYRQATLPRAITWGEVERVLAVADRRTPVGKRDYAILLLLATYGLRAKDVASLRLDDVDWPRAQIHVRARKNGHSTLYPLATGVGDALVDYLQSGRASVADRQIFLTGRSRRLRPCRVRRSRRVPVITCTSLVSQRRGRAPTRFATPASSV